MDKQKVINKRLAEQDDVELVHSCVNGDSEAWESLYQKYYPSVRQVTGWSRWGFSANESEDATQDVFLEVCRSLRKFRGEAQLKTFIRRIAKNVCISHLRKTQAKKRPIEYAGYDMTGEEQGKPSAIALDENLSPEDAAILKDKIVHLKKSFEGIGPDCQQILRLRYFRQLSYQEISNTLQSPLGTVCSRIKRCLQRLAKVVQAQD